MTLFKLGTFRLASGEESDWKLDCDALDTEDWAVLAKLAAGILPPFSIVEGVPNGGLAFAEALKAYAQPNGRLLIAEDVVTTGGSMERHRNGREALGIVAFSRGILPEWVKAVFSQPPVLQKSENALAAYIRDAAVELKDVAKSLPDFTTPTEMRLICTIHGDDYEVLVRPLDVEIECEYDQGLEDAAEFLECTGLPEVATLVRTKKRGNAI